jgi:hypothetical protein
MNSCKTKDNIQEHRCQRRDEQTPRRHLRCPSTSDQGKYRRACKKPEIDGCTPSADGQRFTGEMKAPSLKLMTDAVEERIQKLCGTVPSGGGKHRSKRERGTPEEYTAEDHEVRAKRKEIV